MIVIDKSLGEVNPESYLIKNAKDNTYLLALLNNLNGYNYFEVYIDKLNRSIHVLIVWRVEKEELVLLIV